MNRRVAHSGIGLNSNGVNPALWAGEQFGYERFFRQCSGSSTQTTTFPTYSQEPCTTNRIKKSPKRRYFISKSGAAATPVETKHLFKKILPAKLESKISFLFTLFGKSNQSVWYCMQRSNYYYAPLFLSRYAFTFCRCRSWKWKMKVSPGPLPSKLEPASSGQKPIYALI